MSTILASIVCSAAVSTAVSLILFKNYATFMSKKHDDFLDEVKRITFEHIDRANKKLGARSNCTAFINAAILVLQSFCNNFCLDDEKTKEALDKLVKQMEQEE